MSHGTDKRNQAIAKRAATLKAQRLTSRQIAEALGKRPEQIKALVLLGQRLQAGSGKEGT